MAADSPPPQRPRLGRNVVALLTDVASEMTYPLLPVFLATVLGAGATAVGVIEGAAETTAALLELASGWWSDRVSRRKPLVLAGYALASLVRPFIGVAQSAAQVLGIRVTDRVGKGIRTSPRDALIADSVGPAIRGRAFGFHRAAVDAQEQHAEVSIDSRQCLRSFQEIKGQGISSIQRIGRRDEAPPTAL
ncbi:MAG: MFS transporter [Thermoanaerobaculia bacterium]